MSRYRGRDTILPSPDSNWQEVGTSVTVPLYHNNQGNPKPPVKDYDATQYSYPSRKVREFFFSHRPQWTTLYNQGKARTYSYRTPTGNVYVNPTTSPVLGQEVYTLNRRMYLYNGQVVTE